MPSLSDTFWSQVDSRISAKPQGRKALKRELGKLRKTRNKNTYTNWFKDPRPDVRLSDLEDVAAALDVDPTALVAPVPAEKPDSAIQLQLSFGPDVRKISVQMDATESAVTLRISRSG